MTARPALTILWEDDPKIKIPTFGLAGMQCVQFLLLRVFAFEVPRSRRSSIVHVRVYSVRLLGRAHPQ